MTPALAAAVTEALGSPVSTHAPVGGGDINEAFAATLADGRQVFVKTNDSAPRSMFPAEAKGLAWLREADTLRVPDVLAVSAGEGTGPCFLALEYLAPARRRATFDEDLGRGLAALHRTHPECFGVDHANFIGRLPQDNGVETDWASFYRTRRLAPMVARAANRGLVPTAMRRRFDHLFAILESLVGDPEPPARLHGDLWGGNLHVDEAGEPCLIDPAVYGGHREIDLAMMRLFGGFSSRVFAAYDEAYPRAPGHEERVALYQLYPLLVHVNLFGAGYVASVDRALSTYV